MLKIFIFLISTMLITSCTGAGQNSDLALCIEESFFAVVKIDSGKLVLKVVESIAQVNEGDKHSAKKYLDESVSSEEGDYLFISRSCPTDRLTSFSVFDIAPDRYLAAQKVFRERKINFYTDDYGIERIWVPKSCEPHTSSCQVDINMIRAAYERGHLADI